MGIKVTVEDRIHRTIVDAGLTPIESLGRDEAAGWVVGMSGKSGTACVAASSLEIRQNVGLGAFDRLLASRVDRARELLNESLE